MSDMDQAALEYLYLALKKAQISKGFAERRRGVTQQELDAIQRKIDVLNHLIEKVLKEG